MSVENTHFLFSNICIKYLNKCYNIEVNSYSKMLHLLITVSLYCHIFSMVFCVHDLLVQISLCTCSVVLFVCFFVAAHPLSVSGVLHGQNSTEHHDKSWAAEYLWWGHLSGKMHHWHSKLNALVKHLLLNCRTVPELCYLNILKL